MPGCSEQGTCSHSARTWRVDSECSKDPHSAQGGQYLHTWVGDGWLGVILEGERVCGLE